MSTIHSKDRASLCAFTFADGRRCRTPRQSGHPQFCCFHARRQAQAEAAEQLGRDFAHFFSGHYLSACDLNAALGRLFAATVRGHVPPKTTRTLAYLGQVMVQCIHLTEHEYSNTFGSDEWRHAVCSSANSNSRYLSPAQPAPSPQPQPPAAPPPQPAAISSLPAQAGSRGASSLGATSAPRNPSSSKRPRPGPAAQVSACAPAAPPSIQPAVSSATSSQTPASVEPGSFPATLKSQLKQLLASETASANPSPAQPSQPAPPSPNNPPPSSPNASSGPTPRPPATPAHLLPGFGQPANWDVLIPPGRAPRRRRQIHPWPLPE